ncbi:MFS transporter [Candidatus Saccharibacteria bacterium]|nr:MFS transporter [Candidatus Saccharibacteria bacterium]
MQKNHVFGAKSAKTNRALIIIEMAITSSIMSMAIMTPFFNSVGLNQQQIALSQMVCTAVAMILNIPMGWVADRFSRKWANIIGDLLCATSLLIYSQVNSFGGIVICEALFGLACALSQGVDSSLLKHFADKDDPSGKLFKRSFSIARGLVEIWEVLLLLIAGPIGAISFRLCIALSAVTYIAGAILSFCIGDDSPKLAQTHKNPFRDMGAVTKRCFKNPALRLRIAAFAIGREVTHGIIWVFTPLMMLVGVPLSIVTFGWILSSIMAFAGAELAKRFSSRMSEFQIFAIPFAILTIAGSIMFFNLNIVTIWLYGLFGLVRGWNGSTMMPMIKEHAKASEQSTIESIARVCSQLLYIVTTFFINSAADIEKHYSIGVTLLIFVPLAIPIALKLRHNAENS